MTAEQSFFFQVLKGHLLGLQTDVPSALDWPQLCAYADNHKLSGVFWYQCREALSMIPQADPCCRKLEKGFQAAVFHNSVLEHDLSELRQSFTAAGIAFIPVKGALIAQEYPVPALRTMGDLDILVHKEDAEAIRDALAPLGFSNVKWAEREWDYKRGTVTFELQAELLHEKSIAGQPLNRYFNDFWPHARQAEGMEYRLDCSFHLLYLIAHIAKHMRKSGIGFRQFYDVAVLLWNDPERFDWALIQKTAEDLGFLTFMRSCLALCEIWFGVKSPLSDAKLAPEIVEDVTQRVFRNGLFGFHNPENRASALTLERERSPHAPLIWLKLRLARRLLFPSYKNLCTLEKYKGLRGKPMLLPWYWCKRFFRALRNKRRGLYAKSLLVSSEDVEREQDCLTALGLSH